MFLISFTEVLTNRLALVMNRLISCNQSAFIKSRYILESVATAHELIHSVVKSEDKDIVLKLDYEKAFDRVDQDFLNDLLKLRGFDCKRLQWIWQITHQGSVGVKLNNL